MSSGPASANRYEAIFSGGGIGGAPGWAGLFGINRVRELNDHSKLLITNIIFPGRAYTTGNIRGDRAVGVTRKYITSVMFNEFQMTYTLTADMAVHDLYNQWIDECTPRSGWGHTARKDIRVNYYNNYIDPKIILKKLERDGEVSLITNVYNAFPVNVSDLSMSSGANNSTLEFTVNFTYETYQNTYGGFSDEQVAGSVVPVGRGVRDKDREDGQGVTGASTFPTGQNFSHVATNWGKALGGKAAKAMASAQDGGSGGDGGSGSSGTSVDDGGGGDGGDFEIF